MTTEKKTSTFAPERLLRATAAEMMTRDPVSIQEDAGMQELVAVLTERSISGLPVIDEAGRPVGVVTQADVLIHEREKREYAVPAADVRDSIDMESKRNKLAAAGDRVVMTDPTTVADIMTPVVFSVTVDTPAKKVVQDLVDMKVHRLFVVDKGGILIGVISPLDVLRCML
jgi:CBS-domain-containing membrane protein